MPALHRAIGYGPHGYLRRRHTRIRLALGTIYLATSTFGWAEYGFEARWLNPLNSSYTLDGHLSLQGPDEDMWIIGNVYEHEQVLTSGRQVPSLAACYWSSPCWPTPPISRLQAG